MARWQITDNLWVGGHPSHEDTVGMDCTVSLDPTWARRLLGNGTFQSGQEWLVWPIEDSSTLPDPGHLRAVSRHVCDLLKAGKRVYVHCGEGINRANLVAARALMFADMPLGSVVGLIRERRGPGALSNQAFMNWLMQEG